MHFFYQIRLIERIDYLILTRTTGSPDELAQKLDISKNQLFELLKIMKEDSGTSFFYSRARRSYCYNNITKLISALEEVKNCS